MILTLYTISHRALKRRLFVTFQVGRQGTEGLSGIKQLNYIRCLVLNSPKLKGSTIKTSVEDVGCAKVCPHMYAND